MCQQSSTVSARSSNVDSSGGSICFFHLNICSILNKVDSLYVTLNSYGVDVVTINETWLTAAVPNSALYLPGFRIFSVDRGNKPGGGVCILVKNCFKADCENCILSPDIELIHVVINIPDRKPINTLSIYRPPSGSVNRFFDAINGLLENIRCLHCPLIILGDFNLNILTELKPSPEFNSFTKMHCLRILNTRTASRVTKFSSTLIDHALVKNVNTESIKNFELIDLGYSDHRAITFELCAFKPSPSIIKVVNRPIYPDYALESIHCSLADINCADIVAASSDPDELVDAYFNCINRVFSTLLPTRNFISSSTGKSWINTYFVNCCLQRDRCLRIARRRNSAPYYARFKKLRNKCTAIGRRLRREFFSIRLSYINFINDPGSAWAVLNSLLRDSTSNASHVDALCVSGVVVDTPEQIADEFNSYFTEIVSDIHASKFPGSHSLTTVQLTHDFESFSFVRPSLSDIISAIKRARKNNTSFCSIPIPILRRSVVVIAGHFADLFAYFLEHLNFPSLFKIARVTPVFKSGDKTMCVNYRPISNLPNCSKILERILYNQICDYLRKNDLLYGRQYGFRRHHSTAHCMLDFVNSVAIALDSGLHAAAVFIDFSKAFDMVFHPIMLHKLKNFFNFSNQACNVLSSYLSGRKQYVVVNGVSSDVRQINYGVPQGSILGPLLFLLFINDLPKVVQNSSIVLYADDCTLLFAAKDANFVQSSLNDDLLAIRDYCLRNRLLINVAKTKCMSFSRSSPSFDIVYDHVPVELVATFKFLGTCIDNSLNFSQQVDFLILKLRRAAYLLRRYSFILPQIALRNIYNATVLCYLNFNSVGYSSFLRNSQITKINHYIKMCNKIVFNSDQNEFLFADFSQIASKNCENFIRNLFAFRVPSSLVNTLVLSDHTYDTRYRGFDLYRANKRVGACSFTSWGPKIANKIGI